MRRLVIVGIGQLAALQLVQLSGQLQVGLVDGLDLYVHWMTFGVGCHGTDTILLDDQGR
jgi:hypothetical protein